MAHLKDAETLNLSMHLSQTSAVELHRQEMEKQKAADKRKEDFKLQYLASTAKLQVVADVCDEETRRNTARAHLLKGLLDRTGNKAMVPLAMKTGGSIVLSAPPPSPSPSSKGGPKSRKVRVRPRRPGFYRLQECSLVQAVPPSSRQVH